MSASIFQSPAKSAVISACGLYRYRLDREVQTVGKVFAYFGINPSTADATAEDSTTKKWRGFTVRNGGRKYIVGNPFAYRSTDVKQLAKVVDPVGVENISHLAAIIDEADVLIPCWGSLLKIPPSLRPVVAALELVLLASDKPVMTFGLTKTGDPTHPLMLGYDTPIVELAAARKATVSL